MHKGVLIRYFKIEKKLHNNWKCESPCVNRRVNLRLFVELRCTWPRKYFRVYKLQSLSWVVSNIVRDLYSLWTMYTPIFTKSYETFFQACTSIKWFYANLHN
jgi:hypothetical protein